jgi:nucleoid-associated protein YgaU
MKIKFARRVKFNREITIGLSVLLLLTVILIVVVARRFTRHGIPPDAAMAMEEERLAETRDDHREKAPDKSLEKTFDKTFEEHRSAFAAQAPDALHEREKEKLREPESKEHREARADFGFATVESPKPPAVKHARLEEAPLARKAEEHPAPGGLDRDDRYGVAAAAPPVGPHELRDAGRANPLVIQVSGDSLDGSPRQLDGRVPERRVDATSAEPRRPDNWIGGQRPELADANRPDYHGPRPAEARNEMNGAATYPPRDPRYAYDAGASVPAFDNSQPGYPGPAAGYGRVDMPRRDETARPDGMPRSDQFTHRDEFPRPLAENPLRNDGKYEVQPNDSFWTISQRVYGSGAYFRALAEVNRSKVARPDRLQPGLVISTPPITQLERDYADFCPRPNRREAIRNRAAGAATLAAYSGERIYVVQEGDTLTSIARNELGKVSRWAEIYQLNREALGKDYDYLTPGMKLAMPPREGQPSDRMARRGDDAAPAARY